VFLRLRPLDDDGSEAWTREITFPSEDTHVKTDCGCATQVRSSPRDAHRL